MKICRRETFNSAHRLHHEGWSDEKNLEIFGKCSHPNYHGHNYVIEVWVEGEIDPITGFVMDLKSLKTIIQTEVVQRFDHRNLNLDCPEFKNINPTTENIAKVCFDLIRKRLDSKLGLEVVIHETEKNKVSYSG